ncbi:MAG: terminase small subunit [Candidatus Gastranaerophilaceae bacterium]
MEQLTKQQKKFVKEYIKTLNGEQAAKMQATGQKI